MMYAVPRASNFELVAIWSRDAQQYLTFNESSVVREEQFLISE